MQKAIIFAIFSGSFACSIFILKSLTDIVRFIIRRNNLAKENNKLRSALACVKLQRNDMQQTINEQKTELNNRRTADFWRSECRESELLKRIAELEKENHDLNVIINGFKKVKKGAEKVV